MLREKTEHLVGGSDDGPGVTSLIHLKLSLTHLDFFTNSHRRSSSTLCDSEKQDGASQTLTHT